MTVIAVSDMSAAHRQCARDANTLSSDVGPEDGMIHPLYVLLETNLYHRSKAVALQRLHSEWYAP